MVFQRKRRRGCSIDEGTEREGTLAASGPGYEQLRNQRVKENRERMQNLGILDLTLLIKSTTAAPKRFPNKQSEKKVPGDVPILEPPRRSSRLKTLSPISYSEIRPKSEKGTSRSNEIHIKKGLQPEIYTEEHAKLLGDSKSSWTLSVDGYDQDGKRGLHDSIRGETCHQCRQKTLGQHTHCSQCNLVQGQLCGDCLYMRYGENVMEVIMNPKWICPACRGICNCSCCRKSKGWAPTGAIYRKVCNLGFKSVAHYIIHTFSTQANIEDSSTENLVAADSQQALASTGLKIHQHDHALSSVDGSDFEDEMEDAPFGEQLCTNGTSKKENYAIDDSGALKGKNDGTKLDPNDLDQKIVF